MPEQKKLPSHESFHLLGKRVRIRQGSEGLRAGTDAVLLSACPESKKHVLELGCGVGQALLCYGYRNPTTVSLTGIERELSQVSLAEQNVADNGFSQRMRIVCGDFTDRRQMQQQGICSDSYDLVLLNPPYYEASNFTAPKQGLRQSSHIEETPLADWVGHALRYCTQFGTVAIIHRPARLTELLAMLAAKAGKVRLLPIHSRKGQEAKRILVFAQKSHKGGLAILPALVMHESEGYSDAARRILEEAQALDVNLG